MIDLLIAAALMQTADPCLAAYVSPARQGCPAWRLLSRTPQNAVWMDPASVRRSGNRVEVLTRVVFARAQEGGVRTAILRHVYDCAARTSATLHISLHNAAGLRLDERDMTGDEAAPSRPEQGSPDDMVLTSLCPRQAG